ncbi:MAG: YggS family pyridoxal phosphate-dependent enzyme [Lachnospiraceae bacterium]|nr:YggS family pyridoxal phosphate-dependent enzyme [Lachnospiraceae bacterium]
MIRENLEEVRKNISETISKSGREAEGVSLIAVSKTKPVELLLEAYEAGVRDFGENKVQELTDKYEKLPKDIRWHMIGHLQTNKVKYIVDKAFLIHSVDSVKLAKEISKEAVKKGLVCRILLEVNVADEDSKFGFSCEDVLASIEEIAGLEGIKVAGLMTVAPYVEDPEENRPVFRKLKQLSVDITRKNIDNVSMDILSMGMSGDYQVAIEEGAKYVRVGTSIFGERNYSINKEK